MRPALILALLMGVVPLSAAQDTGERMVRVTEGTNFAVAASPDGERLVMDLQGTLWSLPATGGPAEALTDGLGDDRLPDFHPEGDRVAYQSFRSGTWDIWQLALPAGEPEQLTDTEFDDREPAWSPDGNRIAFSSDRSGSYDIWILDVATGEVTPVTSTLGNESHPAWTPSGDGLVFVETPEGEAEGTVQWLSLKSEGDPGAVPGTAGNVAAPAVSPDGAQVVFRRLQYEGLTQMGTRFDIGTASEWVLAPLSGEAEASETSDETAAPRVLAGAGEDLFPFRPQWLDGRTLLYTADGGIRRLDVGPPPDDPEAATSASAEAVAEAIPMSAELGVRRPPERRGRIRTDSAENLPVRGIIRPSVSPDGTRLLYAALGDIWTAPLDGSEAPLPLTRDTWLDTDPVWLPDGRGVLFASDRGGTMDIWEKQLGSGPGAGLIQLTARLGAEVSPAVTRDGSRIAWLDERGNLRVTSRDLDSGPDSEQEEVTIYTARRGAGMPSWSADGETIALASLVPFSSRYREGRNRIALVAASSGEARLLEEPAGSFGTRDSDGPVFSPDGRRLAFALGGGLAILRLNAAGEPEGPPETVFEGPVDFPSWTPDGSAIVAVSGAELRRIEADGSGSGTIRLRHEFPLAAPSGTLLIHDVGVLDVEKGEVLPAQDVLIEAGRIVSVTPAGEPPPEEMRVVNGDGATLIPGLIEMHTHPMTPAFGNRFGRAHLAYGVTTVRVPAAATYRVIEERESILAGLRVGPRIFLTGLTLDGSRIYYPGAAALSSGQAMDAALQLARELEYDVVKTYVRLDDESQRQAIRRAQRLGAFVTSHELYPAVRYGVNGLEHVKGTSRRGFSPKMTDLGRSYQDVRSLIAESGVFFTPTMLIYGGWELALAREPDLVSSDRRIQAFPAWLASSLTAVGEAGGGPHRENWREARISRSLALMRPMWETVTSIADAGGRVIAGTDTPIMPYGLGFIVEVEQLAEAGLGPAEALRAATLTAAEALGLAGELGVIAPGALADLVLLDGNPLDDIRYLRRVRAVLAGGRLATLDQLLGF